MDKRLLELVVDILFPVNDFLYQQNHLKTHNQSFKYLFSLRFHEVPHIN